MEVHAHTHTPRKKWTHYFWEFLMLFLAVFCGFLAEYQLEHKIEQEKEQVYITSMIEDLKKDTASLAFTIDRYEVIDKRLDTALRLYSSITNGYKDTLWRNLPFGFPDFVKSNKTMQQLLYAGGLRLIKKRKSSDGIIEYDLQYDDLNIDVSTLRVTFYECMGSRQELLDIAARDEDRKIISVADMNAGKKNYLLRNDLPFLGKYNNQIRTFKIICRLVKSKQRKMFEQAVQLIQVLKKEYHLE
ncbi:MAG TPA: hypothetical protein VIU35_04900 [Chitinophagaceae bacterium]